MAKKNKRLLYSSVIWTNTITLVIFISGIFYQNYHEYKTQIEQNNRLLYLIGAEAQRNMISMLPMSDEYIKFRDYQRCFKLDEINEDEAEFIITSAYSIKTDVYTTLLDKFMFLSSEDFKFVMMYYSNVLNFKDFSHSIDEAIKAKGFDVVSLDNRRRLLRQYCVQSQTIQETMSRFLSRSQ
ncbi:hypothetical protein RHA96_08850 [Citrobacter freundii]|uniref:hypothetical protein n=1 Tax=Citrobacter freundii TaxID=546 RepID=UPI0029239560|nr:hypothetical protein RHA96_08850 [Citrobacter freundii]